MTDLDKKTGLPVIPLDGDYYWRVRKASAGYDFHYLQLRRRIPILPFLDWEVAEVPVFKINDENLRQAARILLRRLTSGADSYVGNYPPKKLGEK